ncbi:hypothetical protein [Mesorhizobium sp.]|uniref:oxidoreductase n=1 Tax=Mesorhizobium sp. TaxID=1871066 RepID=UPI002579EBFA|nr:hypothetical protein [Mesorhizobium sp.]
MQRRGTLFKPLQLPCGLTLKNRIAKSAMSDCLGDGAGHPTAEQIKLYQRWAAGGMAVSIIGEVQLTGGYAENPGNLVLNEASDLHRFRDLARHGGGNGTKLWLQLGHAGALAYAPTSNPKGPSALDLPVCAARKCRWTKFVNYPRGLRGQPGWRGRPVLAVCKFTLRTDIC